MDSKFIVIGGVRPENTRFFLQPFFDRQKEGIVLTRDPGGTPLAEELRRILLGGGASDLRVALSLIKAARVDHENRVIGPALERGDDVICDSLDYSLLVPLVKVSVSEQSIMHSGFDREWLSKKPTLLILIKPSEESHESIVIGNIGHMMNRGFSLHPTEVVYVNATDPDQMVETVHDLIANHLQMTQPV